MTVVLPLQAKEQCAIDLDTYPCSLYLGPSTIANGGLGVFSGVARFGGNIFDTAIDLAIPLVDLHKHNRILHAKHELDTIFEHYVWELDALEMDREAPQGGAFAPGLHAAANCHPALLNIDISTVQKDKDTTRSRDDAGAGAMTDYNHITTLAIRDIPQGGELFVDYGDSWFTARDINHVPLQHHLKAAKQLLVDFGTITATLSDPIQRDLYKLIQSVPYSSVITTVFPDTLNQVLTVIQQDDIGTIYQANATRSIDYLEQHGTCLDTIRPATSTIPGAGQGAFATRSFQKGDIIISSPVLHIPNRSLLEMYKKKWSESGTKWKPSAQMESSQLLVNYCFGHVQSTLLLCPYGSGVNFMNAATTGAANSNNANQSSLVPNVRIQWPTNGRLSHNATLLTLTPQNIDTTKVGLALDYIALRDINPGDELFLAAGHAWDEAWKNHVDLWDESGDDDADDHDYHDYEPARVWNDRQAPLRTRDEQRINPYYPHELHCHESLIVDYSNWKSIVRNKNMDLWMSQPGAGVKSSRCHILRRYLSLGNEIVYDVNFLDNENDWEVQNKGVPRNAFTFVDGYYSTDMHLPTAFRYSYQIPNDMVPVAWRNNK